MATTAVPTATSTVPTETERSGLAGWSIWALGAAAGVTAAVGATAVAAVGQGLGVPMEAGPASAAAGELIPLSAYATIAIPAVIIGTVLAVALARWSKRPAATFLVVTIVLTLASFALPHTTQYTTIATRIVLDLTHVVAAALFIPVMAWRLAQVPTRR